MLIQCAVAVLRSVRSSSSSSSSSFSSFREFSITFSPFRIITPTLTSKPLTPPSMRRTVVSSSTSFRKFPFRIQKMIRIAIREYVTPKPFTSESLTPSLMKRNVVSSLKNSSFSNQKMIRTAVNFRPKRR